MSDAPDAPAMKPLPFDVLPDGTELDDRMRALAREAANQDSPVTFSTPAAFVEWLREPVLPDVAPTVGRYLADVWRESSLLRDEFPELEPATADAYLRWCAANAEIPGAVLPTAEQTRARDAARRRGRPRAPRPQGVNVVGYLGAVLGLGEVARNVAEALERAGTPVAAVTNPDSESEALYDVECVAPSEAPYDVNLFVVTADALPPLAGRLGPQFFAGRRNVGLWFWEAERFRPGAPTSSVLLLDEVWTPSAFVRAAVEQEVTNRPVVDAPVPVPLLEAPAAIGRAELKLPDDRFVLLFMFDFFSVTERKNPIGLVDAYTAAFGPDDGVTLVVKSINGERRPDDLAAVRAAAKGRTDIVVRDEYLSPEHHAALLAACDAYVSLHRAEGLGLTMAEAMALGKPVVATGYSGNLDFMDDDVAFLVRSDLVPIGDVDPYPADAQWAAPDLEHAVSQLRAVVRDRDRAQAVGRAAAASIRASRSSAAVGPQLRALVEQARARPAVEPSPWRAFFMRGWRNQVGGEIPRQYRFDWLADGFELDGSTHRLFSQAVTRALAGEGKLPPDPDGVPARFRAWLDEPIAPRRRSVVSRYLVQHWHDHPELHERFPAIETDRSAAQAYVDWVRAYWYEETDIDVRLVPGA